MWFETLTGFPEKSPQQVRANINVDGNVLKSHVNGKSWVWGELETPTLAELRERVRASGYTRGKISVRQVVANVQDLHKDSSNVGALFQVASQFNLLEMTSEHVTPEQGVSRYEHDPTQGPACAIAAGAGTIYRNYFAAVNGEIGQSASNQIDCLADVGAALGNTTSRLWKMQNGYVLATKSGLSEITQRLEAASERELDGLRGLLRIGIQWNTQVTLSDCKHKVSQAYCSALPVAYSPHASHLWGAFARLVLEAAYEATICTAILNAIQNGDKRLFLTLVGGGAYGNDDEWIAGGIQRALKLYKDVELEIAFVSRGAPKPWLKKLVDEWGG